MTGNDIPLPDDTPIYRWGPLRFTHPERAPKEIGGEVFWIEDSPFGVRGVDCCPRSYGGASAHTDPSVPETFARVRELTADAYRGQLPEGAHEVACVLFYPTLHPTVDARLFVPAVYEDRWLILKHGDRIYFVNSYTGSVHLVAQAELSRSGGTTIRRIWCQSGIDHNFAVKPADFLIKSHVLDRWCPHPIPPDIGQEPEAIATDAWLTYGRRGLFATNADTLAIDVDLDRWPTDSDS